MKNPLNLFFKLHTAISKRIKRIPIKGIPDGLNVEVLNKLCSHYLGESLAKVSYVHISSWKKTGAYRLFLQTNQGKQWRLIYKNAIYTSDQIPALVGLPVTPGLPEYVVYSNTQESLTKYLPTVYDCSSVIPGKHYRYLLEDLGQEYQRVSTPEAILQTVKELPAIHRALNEALSGIKQDYLLRYDRQFSLALQEYTRRNLERYSQRTANNTVVDFLQLWSKIAELHGRNEFYRPELIRPLHGDFNLANILIHKQQPNKFKIIDWEWSGLGIPTVDLAVLLKKTSSEINQQALLLFSELDNQLSLKEYSRLYSWCKLERCMLDAAFLCVQQMESSAKTQRNLSKAIDNALLRVMATYHELV